MKKTAVLLVLLTSFLFEAFAQKKTEIVLIGIFHDLPDSLQCTWAKTYQKLVRYKPDQIAIEYDMPDDSASLVHYLGPNYRALWDSVALAWIGQKINAADSIKHYSRLLSQKNNPKFRLQLWKYYHLGTDMGNRDYQTYLIEKEWDTYSTLVDTTQTWGKAFYTQHKSTVKRRKNGEFFNLVFPLARKYNIAYLYPTDNKVTYPAQSEAYGAFAEALENTEDWKKYEAYWQKFIADEAVQKANCTGLEFINSEAWIDHTDFGQTRILAHLKNPDYAEYVNVWYQRNESIASRIIAAAQLSKAKKMVVFYGNMHLYPVKKYLEQQGFKVKLIGDLK